jgi:hypothetical protein
VRSVASEGFQDLYGSIVAATIENEIQGAITSSVDMMSLCALAQKGEVPTERHPV